MTTNTLIESAEALADAYDDLLTDYDEIRHDEQPAWSDDVSSDLRKALAAATPTPEQPDTELKRLRDLVSSAYTNKCPYCGKPVGGSMKGRLENPYCAACLHERIDAAVASIPTTEAQVEAEERRQAGVEVRFRLEFDADVVSQERSNDWVETYMQSGLDAGLSDSPHEDIGTIGTSSFWTDSRGTDTEDAT